MSGMVSSSGSANELPNLPEDQPRPPSWGPGSFSFRYQGNAGVRPESTDAVWIQDPATTDSHAQLDPDQEPLVVVNDNQFAALPATQPAVPASPLLGHRWPAVPLHPVMESYLAHLILRGKRLTAANRRTGFRDFMLWLTANGIDPLLITTEQLQAYQRHLANTYRTVDGRQLCRGSQQTRLCGVNAWYRWMEERSRITIDPARVLRLRVPRPPVVYYDPLTLHEAAAVVQTQARVITAETHGSHRWAVEVRNLAMLCIALATGRRRSGIINLRVEQVDGTECETVGRVLPTTSWAMDVVRIYLREARPLLVADASVPWLFPHRSQTKPISSMALFYTLRGIVERTVAANPDLKELACKRVRWQIFQVSTVTPLFANGGHIHVLHALLRQGGPDVA